MLVRAFAAVISLVAVIVTNGATAEVLKYTSKNDQALIEGLIASTGLASIIVDLRSDSLASDHSEEMISNAAAQLVNSFLQSNSRDTMAVDRLPLSPTFAAVVNDHELQAWLADSRVSRISYNEPVTIKRATALEAHTVGAAIDIPVGRSSIFVGAPQTLYQTGFGGQGQIIAIIDTGIDPDHRAVSGRIVGGHCFSTANSEYESICPAGATDVAGIDAARPCDLHPDCDQGTEVASLAAGLSLAPRRSGPQDDAVADLFGVAELADIYSIKVISRLKNGDRLQALRFDIRRALQHVYQQRNSFGPLTFSAVNISLSSEGSLSDEPCDDDPTAADVKMLRSAGIATIVAAGNSGDKTKIAWPGCITDTVVVASSTPVDTPSIFSNFSKRVDLFAPGEAVAVAAPGDQVSTTQVGTGFSAPHVAGAIAIVRSADPKLSIDDIERALKTNGKPIKIGVIERPRIQIAETVAVVRPNWLVAVPPMIMLDGGPGIPDIVGLRVSSGSVSWRVIEKPDWVDISGLSGVSPANPNLLVWVNALANTFPDGTIRGQLRIHNNTVLQPDLTVLVEYPKNTLPPPSVLLSMVKLDNSGVDEPEQVRKMQADVVVTGQGPVTLVGLGFPPYTTDPAWGWRALRTNQVAVNWKSKNLPPWLNLTPPAGKITANSFENRVNFEVLPQAAKNLTPGQKHTSDFSIEKVDDERIQIPIELELYVHRPPSNFFQVTGGRGSIFRGQFGGPFNTLQPTIEIMNESAPVKWEVSNVPPWLTVSQATGDTPSTVTLSLNDVAKSLPVRSYSTYLVFRNLTGYQKPITRIVSLVITP